MRIALITGGSGFLGGHLAERLVDDGWRVRVLDLAEPQLDCEVEWVPADVRDPDAVGRAAVGADIVYHLGSVVGVDAVLSDPVTAIDVTVNGTLNALRAAVDAGAALVHLSTSEVLGLNPDMPWDESADRVIGSALTDRWSYAAAKSAAEHVVLARGSSRLIPSTVVRPFNVYGPRQREEFVVPLMVAAALRGEALPVHGDGCQRRCFTYVDDAVDALVRIGDRPGLAPLVHVGSTDEVAIGELAALVQWVVSGETVRLDHREPVDWWGSGYEDIGRRLPDVSLARDVWGWTASTPLAEGLRRTVELTRATSRRGAA